MRRPLIKVEVYHIRKLEELKHQYPKGTERAPLLARKMIEMGRKTLVVCKECHRSIHASATGI